MFIICCYLESSVHSLQGVVRGRPERVGGLVPPFLAGADDPLIREVPEELAQDCLQLLVTLDLFNVLAFQELIGHVEAVFINGEELKGRDVEAKLLPNIQVILLYFLHVLFTGFLLVPTAHEKYDAGPDCQRCAARPFVAVGHQVGRRNGGVVVDPLEDHLEHVHRFVGEHTDGDRDELLLVQDSHHQLLRVLGGNLE